MDELIKNLGIENEKEFIKHIARISLFEALKANGKFKSEESEKAAWSKVVSVMGETEASVLKLAASWANDMEECFCNATGKANLFKDYILPLIEREDVLEIF